ncbi:DUF2510 domain-containing protein [Tsukamurella soli]
MPAPSALTSGAHAGEPTTAPAASTAKAAAAAKAAGARLRGTTLTAPTSAPPPVAPAGWYPDPDNSNAVRWWNGRKWTRRVAPRA